MRILALEPYYGGSHKAFIDGLIHHSRHQFHLFTLPARKWKWRMRAAAIWFADSISADPVSPYDLILTSDMLSLADLRALLPKPLQTLPIICYFHENQLTYPIPDEADRDYQYGFTNLTTGLVADRLWFNSRYHLDSFCQAASHLLSRMPDFVPENLPDRIRQKADILHPAITCVGPPQPQPPPSTPPTILWNHRWEYDKNPDTFFETLFSLDQQGVNFRLIVVGEQFRSAPPIFDRAESVLADRIDHWGYVPQPTRYRQLLQAADIVVSTAIHEFFGLAVLEAVSAGCFAVLPNRLSYPELLGDNPTAATFYNTPTELFKTLRQLLIDRSKPDRAAVALQAHRFDWSTRIADFDHQLETLAHPNPNAS